MNVMRELHVDKLTINFGAGKDQQKLEKGMILIKMITGLDAIKTITQHRIPGWGLRPGLPVGAKITVRGAQAEEIIKRLLEARENKLPPSCLDERGNISFGVPEYIEIPGTKYDPKIGIIGIQASITLARPGFRVQRRKNKTTKIGHKHLVTRKDAEAFMKNKFKTEFKENDTE